MLRYQVRTPNECGSLEIVSMKTSVDKWGVKFSTIKLFSFFFATMRKNTFLSSQRKLPILLCCFGNFEDQPSRNYLSAGGHIYCIMWKYLTVSKFSKYDRHWIHYKFIAATSINDDTYRSNPSHEIFFLFDESICFSS